MKKRLFALFMTGILSLGCSFCVMAEENNTDSAEVQEDDVEEMQSVYWSDFEYLIDENENLKNGGFYEEREILGLRFYLPGNMVEYELTEEEIAQGMLVMYSDGESESMGISLLEDESIQDVFDYEAAIREGYGDEADIALAKINDIPAVIYGITDPAVTEDTFTCVAFVAPEGGKICVFTFTPADALGPNQDILQVMMTSIQAIEE